MASIGNPRSWTPYMNSKDCSLGFCSLYCPQWCYTVYPPPPPFEFPDENTSRNFSPLVIAIIGILASAFLLVSCYTIISKYCGNTESSRRENHDPSNNELEDNHNPSLHEPWHVSHTGLDEALINSITICKYKKGDELVTVADCSVCLSEFQDDENIRLLPKCSHAFHLPCIDTWLKSHSTCPLCRSSIFTLNVSALQVSPPVMEILSRYETSPENQRASENVAAGIDNEVVPVVEEESIERSTVAKPALRALSDLSNLQGRHSVTEIIDEGYESIRRSVSMDHSFQSGASVANVLPRIYQVEECSEEAGPSKRSRGESSQLPNYRRRVLHCVLSPASMKRSFSSGRFSFSLSRNGRGGRQGIIPV